MHFIRATLLYRSGDMRGACDAYAAVLSATPSADRASYLDALSNWMAARIDLGEAGMDVHALLDALVQDNRTIGRAIQVARAHWLLGRMHVHRGEYGSALECLRAARLGISDEDASIRIGLDAVHALLLGERHAEAHALAVELAAASVALDRREPSRRRSLSAEVFAYLREAARREVLTPGLVTECARYLDRLVRQPPRAFVPPMPLTEM